MSQSDYDVCIICGSVQECTHDRDTQSECPATQDYQENIYYDMVTNGIIEPESEVYNTYGENLANVQLLSRYGFVLDANEHDYTSWDTHEFLSEIGTADFLALQIPPKETLLEFWSTLTSSDAVEITSSSLVYHEQAETPRLRVDSEGRVSSHLWIMCSLVGLHESGISLREIGSVKKALSKLLLAQLQVEELEEFDEPDTSGTL